MMMRLKMKEKYFLPGLVILLVFVLCLGVAYASEDPLKVSMAFEKNQFSEPEEITIAISISNVGEADMPGPVTLFYPGGEQVEDFGTPILKVGETKSWSGKWKITQTELDAGRITFKIKYSVYDDNGEVVNKTKNFSKTIISSGSTPEITVSREIKPQTAENGQEVTVTYNLKNTGKVDVSNVTIKENNGISAKSGSIASIAVGETQSYFFTTRMGKKDLISAATIAYKAGGKSYSQKVDASVITYGGTGLVANLTADKKGGVVGETVKLTLRLENVSMADFTHISVTDDLLGEVFTDIRVNSMETVLLEKDIVIDGNRNIQFHIEADNSLGKHIETYTGIVSIISVDPQYNLSLKVNAHFEPNVLYKLPDDVKLTVTIINNGKFDTSNITVKSDNTVINTIDTIPSGGYLSFTREVSISMEGTYVFTASCSDALGETQVFSSEPVYLALQPDGVTVIHKSADMWPAPHTEGWDLLDLTDYQIKNPKMITMKRGDVMNNGLLLVNQWHPRPEDFDESAFVGLGNYFNWAIQVADASVSLFPVAADALKEAIDAAAAEDLTHYYVPEAYRSWETQNQYFQNKVEKLSTKYTGDALIEAAKKEVNYPGTSEYNTGLSFRLQLYDKNDKEITNMKYSTSSQGVWMNTHCWEYGFVFRFPLNAWPLPKSTDKSFVTGISSQMNLYRYVGKGNAAIMHVMDFCLEEYIDYLMDHPHIALFEDGQLKYEVYRQYIGEDESFDVMITNLAKNYVSSLDNLGGLITVFEY